MTGFLYRTHAIGPTLSQIRHPDSSSGVRRFRSGRRRPGSESVEVAPLSSVEEVPPRSERGILTTIFAVLGGVATLFVGATGIASLTSGAAQECIAGGQPRLICAVGAMGLADLSGLVEKDRLLAAAKAEVEAKTATAADLDKRVGELGAHVKELDDALTAAKAGAAEAERLKGELAKRDARIAELSDRLTAAAKPALPASAPAPKPSPAKPAPTAPKP